MRSRPAGMVQARCLVKGQFDRVHAIELRLATLVAPLSRQGFVRISAIVASIIPIQPGQSTPRFSINTPSSTGVGMRHSAQRTAGPPMLTCGASLASAPSLTSETAPDPSSSWMISAHTSTHSSQMYTEGPAISLRTSSATCCRRSTGEALNGSRVFASTFRRLIDRRRLSAARALGGSRNRAPR
jgi:hypothetical protein